MKMKTSWEHLSDEKLVEYLRSGSHAAFTEIFERYWGKLLDAAFQRLKSREAAEEVTQAVLVNLYLRREELQPKSSLEAYLKAAVKYKVIDVFRSQQSQLRRQTQMMLDANSSTAVQTTDTIEANELRVQIQRAAEELPDRCRQVFLLSRFEELSHQEIADRLGISVDTVKSHLNRALKMMRKTLGQHWPDVLVLLFLGLR